MVSAGAGSYTVRASYSGDADFHASSDSAGQTVKRADTTTTISSDTNPVTPGGTVTFTVTVTTIAPGDVQPTGTVAILVNGEDVSGPIPLFDEGPTAGAVAVTFNAPTTTRTDIIGAAYSGDASTNPSTSPTFAQTVAATALTPSAPSPSSRSNPPVATTVAALRAMTDPLVRAIRRKGFAAFNGSKETLAAAGPGTLTQHIYTSAAPRPARTSKAKPVLIASGTRTFAASGRGTLRLRLTAAGRWPRGAQSP